MPQYEITNVAEGVRDWQSNLGGPMRSYTIDMKSVVTGTGEALIEWARKPTSPAPHEGMVVEGNIETGQYGRKFKQSQAGGFGGARPEDPKRSAHIARMHAQEMGLRLFDIQVRRGLIEDTVNARDILPALIDWFTTDAEKARDGA